MSGAPEPVAVSREFDGYRLVKLLGRGGMGAVYLAQDTQLERPVALKFILTEDDPQAKKRFIVEARAAARLAHPNAVSVYRVGEVDGMPYIASEFIRGTPLDKIDLPITQAHALKLAAGIARGLDAAHRRGVIHRDIKPANVILSDDGEVKLLDFGIAKLVPKLADSSGMTAAPADPAATPSAERIDVSEEVRPVVRPTLVSAETRPVDMEWAASSASGRRTEVGTLTSDNVLLGTPQFMAPEVWMGEPSDFQSDIYSFGMLLYVLCAGHSPYRADNLLALRNEILSSEVPRLLNAAPHLEPRFAAIVDRCLYRDRSLRFKTVKEVRSALEKLQRGGPSTAVPEGNPYRGLFAFEAEHKAFFFGRESEIRDMLDRLVSETFVLAAGDSGVGKSSLCRAGVLPRLSEVLRGDAPWESVCFVPGRRPLAALCIALAPFFDLPEPEVRSVIEADPGGAARLMRSALAGKNIRLALLIDQLEELATLAEPGESEAVCCFFMHLFMPSPTVRVLATARSDYLGRLAALPYLGDELAGALMFINPLSNDAMREAVTGPAEMTGVIFESQELVDELADAAAGEGGALPLLQFTLAELWRLRDRDKQTISKAALDSMGGVSGALTGHADKVLREMLPRVRAAAKIVLLRLVTAEGTRARISAGELCRNNEEGPAALEAMVRGRLLTASSVFNEATYEIAHEYLIHGWPTLASWLSDNAEMRQTLSRLHAAAKEWVRLGRSRHALWGDRQLRETAEITLSQLPPLEQSFLARSRRGGWVRKVRTAAVIFAIPLAAVLIWTAVRLHAERNLNAAVDRRAAQAESVKAEADKAGRAADALRNRAFEAFDGMRPDDGETLWARYRERRAVQAGLLRKAAESLEAALISAPDREDIRQRFALLLFERAISADAAGAERERDELLARLSLYDRNGALRRKWGAKGTVSIDTEPSGFPVTLERYVLESGERLSPVPAETQPAENGRATLAPGSYRAVVEAAPGRIVYYPFTVQRGERLVLSIRLPDMARVPNGFVPIPKGRFHFGSGAEDNLRRDFFHAVPIHTVNTDGFLIAERETTFEEWFRYLSALPDDERERRIPRVDKGGFQGALTVRWSPDGAHRIRFQPTSVAYEAGMGEAVRYAGRSVAAEQHWIRFPVFGISVEDAQHYTAFLRETGIVPGARLCTDKEWERAARGADRREYPHGNRLAPTDANFDGTYDRKPDAMGPDEVGSRPISDSPFGISDMAGNVWEWTVSSLRPDEFAARGGSYLFGSNTARVAEREITEPTFRDVSVGMRVCADWPRSLSKR